MSQRHFKDNVNYLNANPSNRVCKNCSSADDRSQILTWISPLEPRLRHQDIRERRVKNVGEWILDAKGFKGWYAGSGGIKADNSVLFCYGDPWVGKTYICSLVIDWLCDRVNGLDATVAGFYFDSNVQEEQSSVVLLRALLKQVVGGLEETPKEILRLYRSQKNAIGGREPGTSDIVKLLQTTASKKRIFICIDALDECAASQRVKILDSLGRVLQNSPGTRIFVTGRSHVRPEIDRRLSRSVTSISITPQRGDIISYLHTRLGEDINPDAMNSTLKSEILNKIPQDISGIFLSVSLCMDAILQETTIRGRRQKLNAMTNGLELGDAYGATLGRIKAQGGERSRLGIAALMWITHSERPLGVDELFHALGVEIGSPNLDADGIPAVGTLLACCQGLVVGDGVTSRVRLVHFTLRDYLRAHPELLGKVHSTIAETCLSYLNSEQVKALSTGHSRDCRDTPFLEYASLYWGVHARRELSDCAKSLALKLFDNYDRHISIKILLMEQDYYVGPVSFGESPWFSGLHAASYFGITEIVAGLVKVEGCDINQTDCTGNTPLAWAAFNGHEEVVKTLCGQGDVCPDEPDIHGITPLSWAASKGHDGVVKILLRRGDVSPEKPAGLGFTPLYGAAECGYEGVVKALLQRHDVNPNKPVISGQTPLCAAAKNGHEGVVKILLDRADVDPDQPDNDGLTPLGWATNRGHVRAVTLLQPRTSPTPSAPYA